MGHMRYHEGRWMADVSLKSGVYQYKYLVDDQWFFDVEKTTVKDNSGNVNNILIVSTPVTLDGVYFCKTSVEKKVEKKEVEVDEGEKREEELDRDNSSGGRSGRVEKKERERTASTGSEILEVLLGEKVLKNFRRKSSSDHFPIPTKPSDEGLFLPERPPLIKQPSEVERALFNSQPSLFNRCDYEPNLTANAPPPKLRNINRQKFSSTATIFLRQSICAPDVAEIVICLSRALYWKMKQNEPKEPKRFRDIFSEEKHPLEPLEKTNYNILPTQDDIFQFLVSLFSIQELDAVCGVLASAYIDRLIKLTGVTLHPTNWRRIVLGALLLASKVWEDLGVWNIDYQYIFPSTSLEDLRQLEMEYLNCLQFTVTLTSTMYAKYYFELRAISDTEYSFPLEPLDQEGAEKIEARSRGVEIAERNIRTRGHRSSSLDAYEGRRFLTLEQFQNKVGKKWQKEELGVITTIEDDEDE